MRCGQNYNSCKYPHRCSFSKSLHEYICCRSATAIHPLIATIQTATIKTKKKEDLKKKTNYNKIENNIGTGDISTEIIIIQEKLKPNLTKCNNEENCGNFVNSVFKRGKIPKESLFFIFVSF